MQPRTIRSLLKWSLANATNTDAGARHGSQRWALALVLQYFLLGWGATQAAAQVAVPFVPHNDFTTGTQPIAVAVGDLNNDGKLDLAVADFGFSAVSVLMGDGTGGFGPRTDFPAADRPHGLALGDFNGDGLLDMGIANFGAGTVSILLGTGGGVFGSATQVPTGIWPYSVAVADLNADGKLDLVFPNNGSNTVSVMLGNGAGAFGARVDYATGTLPTYVAIKDLNGDGKPDLVVPNGSSNTVSVMLNTGGGSFGSRTDFPTGNAPWSVAAGDVNGDGIPDLAVSNTYGNTVSILLGTGLGGFGPKVDYASGPNCRALALGDVNGDGTPDVVVPNEGSGSVSVLLGNGIGGFTARTDYAVGASPYTAAIGDFNGDGLPDLASANIASATVSVLMQVNSGPPTTCILTMSPNPSVFGETVALVANVTPASATGAINFLDGVTSLGVASLTGGAATISVSALSAGIHRLTAAYGGDASHGGSTAQLVTQTVSKAVTTTQVATSLNPSLFTESVTFTATLGVTAPGSGHPTGSVQFKIDGLDAGAPVAVDVAGAAHMSTIALAVGDHAVQGVFGGDANFNGSASTALNQNVASPSPSIVAVRDVANDQGGRVFLTWRSPLDKPGMQVVTGYRVWRRAPNPSAAALRAPTAGELDPPDETSRARIIRTVLPDGTVLEGYWQAMATLPAEQLINYAYEAATTQDSIAGSNPNTAFFVTALTADPFVFFQSAPDSGYSVDNLSPPTPAPFAALYYPGSTALHWVVSPAPDFREFRLYRGLSPQFVPGPSNLVIATRDTSYVDISPTPYVYKLAATDVHGNPSRYAVVTPNGPVATLAALIAVDAQPDRIRLTWYAAGNPGVVATVYRRTANTDWISFGPLASDGTGYLRYVDASVQTGTQYGYRLGIMDAGAEVFVGEAWATAERLVLALDGAQPNPAFAGQVTVFFSLPNAGPAKLELIDVSGRRWATRDVGSLGPGGHSVSFVGGGRIPPGIYLTRLTQGGQSLTRRVAVVQ